MLTYKNKGIQKFILDRLTQIHDEIVKDDPELRSCCVSGVRSLKFEV